ncbi:MAG: ABC transporter substrate-binding protein [Thermoplasmata archaeon]
MITLEKKSLYAILTIIVVLVIIIAAVAVVLYKPTLIKNTPTSPTLVSVTPSTQLTTVGSSVQFVANVKGNVTSVLWNFGDGTTGSGLIVNHTYNEPGKYLVFANATGPNGYSNNLNNLWLITVSPQTLSPALASEVAQPTVAFNTTLNPNAPIFSQNSSAIFDTSYLQPPTATNWTIGYYVINYGDGSPVNITPALYNTSSGNYLHATFSHVYKTSGFYAVNITIVTYNESSFMSDLVTNNVTSIQYLPASFYNQVIGSEHHVESYFVSIYVEALGQKASIIKYSGSVSNQGVINEAEVVESGPYSFDPAIDYETVGMEVIANVYETLIAYNASSTSEFIPVIAKEIPTFSNGGISQNGLNYTFYIRNGLKFSNGDLLNVWDVYVSYVRTLLFMLGSPGTPGWILAQDLLPGGGFLPGAISYQNITKAITYDNATQTITFHLLKPDPAFLDYLADPEGASVLDWNWLVQHGAGITFTPAGFQAYMSQANEQDYNNYIRYNAMGSGPYMIQSYLSGQSIVLAPNPNFTPIPGYPGYSSVPTEKVYIQWVKDPETALLMMKSGQSDITVGLPTTDYPTVAALQSQGKLNIYSFPTLSIFYFTFNWNINETMMHGTYGSQYNIPSNYFMNPYVRAAFADAFNYTNYIDNLVGNSIYHANFAFHYIGAIPKGMPGYVNATWLQEHGATIPQYNLALAKHLMEESGAYNESVSFPIVIYAGDPVDFAAAGMWAQALYDIDPNIQATPVYQPFTSTIGYQVSNMDPMPIYLLGWAPDYPYPSDYVNAMYLQGGTYAAANGWNYTNLMNAGWTQEAQEWQNMTNLILKAGYTTNITKSLQYYDEAEVIAVNLNLYVYTEQLNQLWYYAPYLHGAQYEENPILGGGGDTLFFYLTKN